MTFILSSSIFQRCLTNVLTTCIFFNILITHFICSNNYLTSSAAKNKTTSESLFPFLRIVTRPDLHRREIRWTTTNTFSIDIFVHRTMQVERCKVTDW